MNAARGSNVAGGLHAASGPNDGSGPNTTSGTNERVDEVFYEELNDVDGDSIESDWVDGDNLLSDDDDEEEMVAIKNKSKLVKDLGPDVVLEESVHVSIEKNEDLKGLGGGEETDYLDSSDAGSYETDSNGGIICKKSAHSFDFRFVSNRKEKIRVVCKANECPFLIHTSWDKSNGCYKIKTLVIEHQCSITFKNKRANYKLIVEMQNLGREELKVELQKHTCIKARKWALEKIRGSVVLEFNREEKLEDYVFDSYNKHVYVDLYTATLPTILSEKFWKDTKMDSLDPPLKRKLYGRPKQKRKREEGEMSNGKKWSKQGARMNCRLYGVIGHNIRTCPNKNSIDVQTESAQTKFAQPATTSSPPTQPMPNSPHTQPLVVSKPSRYNVTAHEPRGRTIMQGLGVYTNEETKLQILNPGRPSQMLLSRPHIRSNLMASTTSQPIISQSHYTSSQPTVASSRHSTTISKPQGERRPKLPTMKRIDTMRRP
ncbi:hypothetical protein GQ457_10G021840 [Hibiscus cannabinus]